MTKAAEVVLAREPIMLMTHSMVLSIDAELGVVVRVFGKDKEAAYVGMSPERAIAIGEEFIKAGRRLAPIGAAPPMVVRMPEAAK